MKPCPILLQQNCLIASCHFQSIFQRTSPSPPNKITVVQPPPDVGLTGAFFPASSHKWHPCCPLDCLMFVSRLLPANCKCTTLNTGSCYSCGLECACMHTWNEIVMYSLLPILSKGSSIVNGIPILLVFIQFI